MLYTDDEIRKAYRCAENKEAQVTILADLNDVSVPEMEQKLEELGLRSAKKRTARSWKGRSGQGRPSSTSCGPWSFTTRACAIWTLRSSWASASRRLATGAATATCRPTRRYRSGNQKSRRRNPKNSLSRSLW